MTRPQVIENLCRTVSLAYLAVGDHSHASDCFCHENKDPNHFQHQGKTLEFVRQAVIEKLRREVHHTRLEKAANTLKISLDNPPAL